MNNILQKVLQDLESGLINSKEAFVLLSKIPKKHSVKNYEIKFSIGSRNGDRFIRKELLTLNENDELNEKVQNLLSQYRVYSSHYQEMMYARLIKVSLID